MIALISLAVVALLAIVALAIWSHFKEPDLGLVNGKLRPCSASPNCVCSESYAEANMSHQIPPVKVSGKDIVTPWKLLGQAVVDQGGNIVREDDGYLHAEFSSSLFRFMDDLELRMDRQEGLIHIRSASRVGHSDFGVNRKRVEMIWQGMGTTH